MGQEGTGMKEIGIWRERNGGRTGMGQRENKYRTGRRREQDERETGTERECDRKRISIGRDEYLNRTRRKQEWNGIETGMTE